MSRILLAGVGPMPRPGVRRIHATGLRLEAFLGALLRAGCEVAIGEFYFAQVDDEFTPRTHPQIKLHRRLSLEREKSGAELQLLIDAFSPDAIVALTDVGALCACGSKFTGPIHVDYFGHPMAERQQQGAAHGSDASLAEQWLAVLPVLLRADRFSVCSHDQRLALIGELGAAGRLNQFTSAYDFAEIVPPTLPFAEPLVPHDKDLFMMWDVPADGIVILCSGGYNTWVDEETLFKGIEQALSKNAKLHFVSTGGAIEGHVENVYARFEQRVKASPLRDRMHLLGWLPQESFEDAVQLSHVGVNCDVRTYEGELGCRNRLYGWLWGGLRVVTTVSSEPTRKLVEQGWVTDVPFSDASALCDAILAEAAKPREADQDSRRRRLQGQWGAESFYADFSKWVQNPTRAPDRTSGTVVNPLADLQRSFLSSADESKKSAELKSAAKEIADRLSGSSAFQLYVKLHPEIQQLIDKLKS